MGRYDVRPCPCGSGKDSQWQYDARGIELTRTCDDCHKVKMAGYRQDVLDNVNYEANEPIEPDTGWGFIERDHDEVDEDRMLAERWEPDDDWPM